MLPDSLENNYMNNEVEIALGNNFYNLSFESMPYINDSINFDPPLINDDDQLSLWISSMKKIDDNKYKININAASLVDINGLQFQLSHFKYIEFNPGSKLVKVILLISPSKRAQQVSQVSFNV